MIVDAFTLFRAFAGIGPLALFIGVVLDIYIVGAIVWTEAQVWS